MEILKQYNNNTLELITSGDYEFTSFDEAIKKTYHAYKESLK